MRNVAIAGALVACSHSPKAMRPLDVQPGPPPALRLPGDVRPTRVALDLTIIPEREVAEGQVTIAATVVSPTRVVWLNATDLVISQVEIAGHPAKVVQGNADFVGLAVDQPLAPGPITIAIRFVAKNVPH